MKTLRKLLRESVVNEEVMSDAKIAVAIRSMIAAEFDAIKLYTEFLEAIENEQVKAVLASVIEEERVHVGEFQQLLFDLDPQEKELYDRGAAEVNGGSSEEV